MMQNNQFCAIISTHGEMLGLYHKDNEISKVV